MNYCDDGGFLFFKQLSMLVYKYIQIYIVSVLFVI